MLICGKLLNEKPGRHYFQIENMVEMSVGDDRITILCVNGGYCTEIVLRFQGGEGFRPNALGGFLADSCKAAKSYDVTRDGYLIEVALYPISERI